jgi:hypothetical protein
MPLRYYIKQRRTQQSPREGGPQKCTDHSIASRRQQAHTRKRVPTAPPHTDGGGLNELTEWLLSERAKYEGPRFCFFLKPFSGFQQGKLPAPYQQVRQGPGVGGGGGGWAPPRTGLAALRSALRSGGHMKAQKARRPAQQRRCPVNCEPPAGGADETQAGPLKKFT